jgi:hypothetical protein
LPKDTERGFAVDSNYFVAQWKQEHQQMLREGDNAQ